MAARALERSGQHRQAFEGAQRAQAREKLLAPNPRPEQLGPGFNPDPHTSMQLYSNCHACCLQANAAAGYKALAVNAGRLGYRVGDVKSTVLVAPMGWPELQATAGAGVGAALRAAGWHWCVPFVAA